MKKTIILITAVLSLFSCERFYIIPDAMIRGYVIDSTTMEKIPDAEVTLYRNIHCTVAAIEFCDEWERVKSEMSNDKGKFKLNFNDAGKEYRISAEKEGYYKSGFWYRVAKDREDVDCYLFPQAILNIHIKNTNPYDINDIIYLDIVNNGNAESYTTSMNITGNSVDTVIQHTVYGNYSHILNWTVIKNNITEEFSTWVHCIAQQETNFNIDY